MKEANLISVLNAYRQLSPELFKAFLEYHSIEIKQDEINDLQSLVTYLQTLNVKVDLFDKFFIGFKIPQIGKEFDLLRINNDTIVNIELKKSSTPEKIKKQLLRNKYYLSFLNKEIYGFTYVSSENKLYSLDYNQNVIELNIKQLVAVLISQKVSSIKKIESYFNPSNYLVSPFNSTEEFIKGKYFLTNHQEKIKNQIIGQLSSANHSIFAIKGKAGTGKTLLTYDIANEASKQNEVLIIHCGYLNEGHVSLRDNYLWNIVSAKYLMNQDFSKYSLIIIDEAQRIYKPQLVHAISEISRLSKKCIFSYDGQQTLRRGEIVNNVEEQIEKAVTVKPFELKSKIRTNKEVASFVYGLFDKGRPIKENSFSNIKLNYFDNYEEAKLYMKQLNVEEWKIINYTPSTVHTLPYEQHQIEEEKDNAHTVIGQEYDNVVAVIDEYFYYKGNNLSTRQYRNRPYYHPTKMLFQIVSRTRIGLNIIIIKNEEILSRCLEIMKLSN